MTLRPFSASLIIIVLVVALGLSAPSATTRQTTTTSRNVVLFVPDGLRALAVTPGSAPTLAALRDRGVNFAEPHSLFPTVTTANASAMATGHFFGDTGDFSNSIFSGFPSAASAGSVTPFLENDAVLGEMDDHLGGNYLNESTLLELARGAGLSTAAIGKLGPTLIFDHRDRTGAPTIIVDDSTGTATGIALSDEIQTALRATGLPVQTPSRGDNGRPGNSTTPGTRVPNVAQQDYFVDVATKVVLPLFKTRGRPFLLVFWSRDPDGTQHNQGDSLNQLTPGINGPTSFAAVKNADDNLARIERALDELGLAATTNIVVSADHGFSTVSKQSATSPSARLDYPDVPHGFIPPGFVTLDLARALGMTAFDPDNKNAVLQAGTFPRHANGLLGHDPLHPEVIVAANGGSDLIYLPRRDRALAARVISALLAQDYVSGIFVDDALGTHGGALPLSAINLIGVAVTPRPSIIVSFRSTSTGCEQPLLCGVELADTTQQQGQGMHGSFSRADTMNFMAAAGPNFKTRYIDPAPASNADVGQTIAHILNLSTSHRGSLVGRALTEALLAGGAPPRVTRSTRSSSTANGLRTTVAYQQVERVRYFDTGGFAGRTVGLPGKAR